LGLELEKYSKESCKAGETKYINLKLKRKIKLFCKVHKNKIQTKYIMKPQRILKEFQTI
jgi:hypothetical protein